MKRRALLALAAALPLGACASPPGEASPGAVADPYEDTNRAVFRFNEALDRYALDPLAEGWEFVTFEGLRKSVNKFFVNLAFPRRFVSNLGQAHFAQAGNEAGRFVLNTTVGLLGFFDPATHIGMKLYDEDFGQMFGAWGIGDGPYWVLPVFGPSNPRDTVGFALDLVFDVRTITAATPVFTLAWTGVVQNVNRRAMLDEQIDAAREAALDFYVFQRDAYIQRRRALVADEAVEEEYSSGSGAIDEDIYDLPDESDGDVP